MIRRQAQSSFCCLDGLFHCLVLNDDVEILVSNCWFNAYLLRKQQTQDVVGILQLEAIAGKFLLTQPHFER